jgi:hypothetical protein
MGDDFCVEVKKSNTNSKQIGSGSGDHAMGFDLQIVSRLQRA